MPSILSRALSVFTSRHRNASTALRKTSPASPDAPRALADAIDRALNLGLLEHADRLAEAAARLPDCPRLNERIARLRLLQGRPELALESIDAVPLTSSLRLLRAVCLVHVGCLHEAHEDLYRWSQQPQAPIAARHLLAILEWESGDPSAARAALARNLDQIEDVQTLELLVLLAAAEGRDGEAIEWAERLAMLAPLRDAREELLLDSLSLDRPGNSDATRSRHSAIHVKTLAAELAAAECAIPALIEAQRLAGQDALDAPDAAAELLYDALQEALPELSQTAAACEALAKLAIVLDDPMAAIKWADRGLEANPMSASLALVRQSATAAMDERARAAGDALEQAA